VHPQWIQALILLFVSGETSFFSRHTYLDDRTLQQGWKEASLDLTKVSIIFANDLSKSSFLLFCIIGQSRDFCE